jgi:predicted PurR-regulated permease PerM
MPLDRYLRLLIVTTLFLLWTLAAYLALRVLASIRHTVLLFALGGLLAYALDPIVEIVRGNAPIPRLFRRNQPPVMGRKHPRWLGVLAVFGVLLLVFGSGTFLLGREAIHQATVLSANRDEISENFQRELDRADQNLAARGIPFSLRKTYDNPPERVREWGKAIAASGVTVATDVSRFAVEGIVVFLIAVYFLIFSEEMREAMTNALPESLRPYASQWQNDVNRILGGFVRGQAILALVLGAGSAVICALLGLRFWLLIGAFVVVASLIPVLGPYIGAIPAILSALLTPHGYLIPGVRVALVILFFFILNEFGSKVLYPKLVGKALGLHEVAVLFALLAGFEVGGIVGVLFAAPLTALTLVTIAQLWRLWKEEPPVSVSDAAETAGEEAKAEGVP